MVRSFTLRDLALVRRLSEQGICLHTESALADNLHHLRDAVTGLVAGGKSPTLVYKSEEGERAGFIQILLEEHENHAHILYLSPSMSPTSADDFKSAADNGGDVWLQLLDKAVAAVGGLGVHSLVAEVDEQSVELLVLRQAGFAVYTRQDIWLFDGQPGSPQPMEPAIHLLPYSADDEWDVQLLYANTVPRLVQLVESAPPIVSGNSWVLRDKQDELVAFVHVHDGSAAKWMRFFIHPSAEVDAFGIVQAALTLEFRRGKKPVYCCVRRYEGWLSTALKQMGFNPWGSQAVLVKHTVQYKRRVEPQLAVRLENNGLPATSPFVRRYPIEEIKDDDTM